MDVGILIFQGSKLRNKERVNSTCSRNDVSFNLGTISNLIAQLSNS